MDQVKISEPAELTWDEDLVERVERWPSTSKHQLHVTASSGWTQHFNTFVALVQ